MLGLLDLQNDGLWGEPRDALGEQVCSRIHELHEKIRVCESCRLWKSRKNAVPGEGHLGADLILVGEAPGRDNDECGRPFVGQGGKHLDSILHAAGLRRGELFITNIVKCWPPDNRSPKNDEVRSCSHFLKSQIELIRPKAIVALGGSASKALLGRGVRLAEVHGQFFETSAGFVFPTYHPSAVRYNPSIPAIIVEDLKICIAYISSKRA